MKKEEFNEVALRVMRMEHNSKERSLEKLDEMEGECLQRGLFRLLPKINEARIYVKRHCYDY